MIRLNKRQKRRLYWLMVAVVLASAFVFFASVWSRHSEGMFSEKTTIRCEISICTPCQHLHPEMNTDTLGVFYSADLYSTQYRAFPPATVTHVEDLPNSGPDRIEKRLHQKWSTVNIPAQFRNYIKSFIDNHISWQYMFWTDQSTRQFIVKHYPNLLFIYDNYANPLNRADAMRYMVLFYYGGVYSDLDVKSLLPLDSMIKKYSCFLGQEPYVHSIVYTNFYELVGTSFIACRKKHPFMKNILNNLPSFSYFSNEHDSTGPRFFTHIFRDYLRHIKDMEVTDNDYVYLTPPEYFNPTADPGLNGLLIMQCMDTNCLSTLRKWQCDEWRMNGLRTEPFTFSFTNHIWAHIAYKDMSSFTYIDIFDICPNAFIYK